MAVGASCGNAVRRGSAPGAFLQCAPPSSYSAQCRELVTARKAANWLQRAMPRNSEESFGNAHRQLCTYSLAVAHCLPLPEYLVKPNPHPWKSHIVAFVAVFCTVLGAGLLTLRWRNAPHAAEKPVTKLAEFIPNWRELASVGHTVGDSAAPVTLLLFTDYQCPGCAELHRLLHAVQDSLPVLPRIVTRHFPLSSHPFAMLAANAAECADRQGRFASFQEALYTWSDSIGVAPWRFFVGVADIPDTLEMSRCIGDGRLMKVAARDRAVARSLKLEGTPIYIINGRRHFGAPSLAVLVQQLREAHVRATADRQGGQQTDASGNRQPPNGIGATGTASTNLRWQSADTSSPTFGTMPRTTGRFWLPMPQLQASITGATNDELLIPGNLTATPSGNLLIFDYGSMELRTFAPNGRPLWRAGSKGSGPGEFRNVMDVEALPDGSVMVLDMANRRATTFADGGRLLRTAPVRRNSSRFIQFSGTQPLALAGDDTATLWITEGVPGLPAQRELLPNDMPAHHSLVRELFSAPLSAPTARLTKTTAGSVASAASAGAVSSAASAGAVIAFRWSDRIFTLGTNGEISAIFHGIEPVELPSAKSYPLRAGKFQGSVSRVAPEATPAALSVAADTSRILVLFAGRSTERGRIIDTYHRQTGTYLGSYLLPQQYQEVVVLANGAMATLRAEPVPAVDVWLDVVRPKARLNSTGAARRAQTPSKATSGTR